MTPKERAEAHKKLVLQMAFEYRDELRDMRNAIRYEGHSPKVTARIMHDVVDCIMSEEPLTILGLPVRER